MQIKDEPDISRYLEMREGKMKLGEHTLYYRVTEPIWLALTGQDQELEKMIGEGMAVEGVTPAVCRELSRPMCLHLDSHEFDVWKFGNGESMLPDPDGVPWWPYMPESDGPVYYTTMEAAVMGRQKETIRMLLKKGMKPDLRRERFKDIVCQCDDREVLELLRDIDGIHWDILDGWSLCGMGRRKEGWNKTLLEMISEEKMDVFDPPTFPDGFELPDAFGEEE